MTDVRPLAVFGGGVVYFKENVQQLSVSDYLRVIIDFDGFGVSGFSAGNLSVGRVGQ